MPVVTKHKVAKNDKLAAICKQYGHKDWKLIWKDKQNAALVKLRKTPEGLQPGDVVVIPPTPKELKEQLEYVQKLQETLSAETLHVEYCDKFIKQFETMAALNTKYAAQVKKDYDLMIKEALKTKSAVKRRSQGVDVAADIALLFVAVGKLGQASKKAATSSGKQLDEINKAAQSDAMAFAFGPVQKVISDAGTKYLTDAKAGRSYGALLAGSVFESVSNLTKPSFWGKTVVKLHDGASWSDAVTADFEKDIDNAVAKLKNDQTSAIAMFNKNASDLKARVAEMRKMKAKSQAHIKNLERELKDML